MDPLGEELVEPQKVHQVMEMQEQHQSEVQEDMLFKMEMVLKLIKVIQDFMVVAVEEQE